MDKKRVTRDISYIGVNDHLTDLFEGQFKIPNGMSYNSYAILDYKVAIVDSVDSHFADQWLNNIRLELKGRRPDYLIISHMEPDHSGSIMQLVQAYPAVLLVGNQKTFQMLDNMYPNNHAHSRIIVKDGDTLDLGEHILRFIYAPMVHWPEVMFTYDERDGALFSADAFGKFGALDVDEDWDKEARRYYYGIVGKYGNNVIQAIAKISELDIKLICPLHGPVLLTSLDYYVSQYVKWANYEADQDGVLIAVSSAYGSTMKVANKLRDLCEEDYKRVVIVDLARCDISDAVAKAFKYKKLVLASITYNCDIFPPMKTFIEALVERNYQKRSVGFIENGSWSPNAAKVMKSYFEKSKDITILPTVTVKSAVYSDDDLKALADALKD